MIPINSSNMVLVNPNIGHSVIPQTKEKFMSLTARIEVDTAQNGRPIYFNVVFLDSYQFMSFDDPLPI